MSQPLVSILIPAFRPDWLDVTIASAFSQTHRDFELLISDDSSGDAVRSVIEKWKDPRLRYMRNPTRGEPGTNRDYLISQARGRYVKFLFDDDFLLPRSLEILLDACEGRGAHIAFHNRHIVDSTGRVLSSPALIKWRSYAEITTHTFFSKIVAQSANYIGEPSNVMIHAPTLKAMIKPFSIDGRRMRFLTDMALYTNFMARGYRMVGSAEFASAFRLHDGQTSNSRTPSHSAGLYEWELLQRWSAQHRHLSPSDFSQGHTKLMQAYTYWATQYPELYGFLHLERTIHDGVFLSPQFLAALHTADNTIALRTA